MFCNCLLYGLLFGFLCGLLFDGFFYEGLTPEQKYYLCLKLFKGTWVIQKKVMEKKYCSGCQRDRTVDCFTGNYQNCERCREKGKRKSKANFHCDVCNCDIRNMGKARHELTDRHEENLKKE